MPSVALHVVEFTFAGGFESFPLRQQVLTAEKSRRLFPRNRRKMPIFRDSSSANRTAEKGPLDSEGGIFLAFLWKARAQSGFEEGIRRMQCDHKRAIRPRRVDFASTLETKVGNKRHGSVAASAFIVTYVVKLPRSRLVASVAPRGSIFGLPISPQLGSPTNTSGNCSTDGARSRRQLLLGDR
jgi:hypothetical protein